MEVYRLLGITLAKTTAYHPQADGQTEQVNQELEQYLRLFVRTPFLLDSGQHPRMGFEPQPPAQMESVNKFTNWMKFTLEEAKAALVKAKDDMTRYYN